MASSGPRHYRTGPTSEPTRIFCRPGIFGLPLVGTGRAPAPCSPAGWLWRLELSDWPGRLRRARYYSR